MTGFLLLTMPLAVFSATYLFRRGGSRTRGEILVFGSPLLLYCAAVFWQSVRTH